MSADRPTGDDQGLSATEREALTDWLREHRVAVAADDVFAAVERILVARADKDAAAIAAVRALCVGDYANSKHVSGYAVVRVNDVLAALDVAPPTAEETS